MAEIGAFYAVTGSTARTLQLDVEGKTPGEIADMLEEHFDGISMCHQCAPECQDPEAELNGFHLDGVDYERELETGHWVALTRSPLTSWNQPRSMADCLHALEANGFLQALGDDCPPAGVALVRATGILALRVRMAHGRALLETARPQHGKAFRWRAVHDRIGYEPWRVTREALELLAVLDVDTPIRWG
jgi:hypothetical protein